MKVNGNKIKELRHKILMSQTDLANASGLWLTSINKMEKQDKSFYWSTIKKIIKVFNENGLDITLDDII